MHRFRRPFAMLLHVGLCAMECAARRKALPAPPDPRFLAIQNVSVLPIVDARAGDKASINLGKLQTNVVSILLKRKHYPASAAGASGMTGEIAPEDVEGANPAYIQKLGAAGDRWVLVVFLNDVTSKITFGSTGNAEVSGYLFDKEDGALLWRGRGVGQAGQGGLMGMTMKGMMKGEALSAALFNLFASMPNRPKPGR